MESKNEMDIFLGWLSDDPENAVELYFQLRKKLTYYFHSFTDPEGLADEAIDRALKNLKKESVKFSSKAESYVFGIARLLRLEIKKKENRLILLDDWTTLPSANSQDDEKSEKERYFNFLEICLKETLQDELPLFLKYMLSHEGESIDKTRAKLASELNITLTNLRVKMFRMRDRIRKCVEAKLNKSE